jgi:hypothetical protein
MKRKKKKITELISEAAGTTTPIATLPLKKVLQKTRCLWKGNNARTSSLLDHRIMGTVHKHYLL